MQSKRGAEGLTIGIPRESSFQETRIALTPHAVQLLTDNGFTVLIESKAGKEGKFGDKVYEQSGARIVLNREEVFGAKVVVKVSLPTEEEIKLLGEGSTLISALHLAMLKPERLKQMMAKNITALCFEFLQDDTGAYPVIQAMSEIAGSLSIIIASEYLSNIYHGKGVMLGGIVGIPPSEVVILGAGMVGIHAARTASALGAVVKVFDSSLARLRRFQSEMPNPCYTSVLQPHILLKALKTADVAIGAIRAGEGSTPHVVSEEMVMQMKPGSVIVDVSIDQGGCFETSKVTTHTHPIFEKHGVIHYCVPNIASRVARTASYALSNILTPILLDIAGHGGIKPYLWATKGSRHGTYIYKGMLTNINLAERFKLPHKDLNLLVTADFSG